jgi:NAD(P)-dependent dehydrogenase (short-subunit alcohol dehydrogenase family)
VTRGAQNGVTLTRLITGANKSLGLETTRRLIEPGHTVYAGMRDTANGAAARALGARPAQIDATDQTGVHTALSSLPELDVLINNAGTIGTSSGVEHRSPRSLCRACLTRACSKSFVLPSQRSPSCAD